MDGALNFFFFFNIQNNRISYAKVLKTKYYYLLFRIPPRVEGYHVFDKWHVAFYGTLIGRLRRILDLGDIPLQGIDPHSQVLVKVFSLVCG